MTDLPAAVDDAAPLPIVRALVYRSGTGDVLGVARSTPVALDAQMQPGEAWVAHDVEVPDLRAVRVVDGAVVATPTDDYTMARLTEAMDILRRERDTLLATCDWTVAVDSPLPLAERRAWERYRQALRDWPATVDDPLDPSTWPVAPPDDTDQGIDARRRRAVLSTADFVRRVHAAGILDTVSAREALTGAWPAPFQAAIADMDDAAQVDAVATWAKAASVEYAHPLMQAIAASHAAATGTEAAAVLDGIFGIAP